MITLSRRAFVLSLGAVAAAPALLRSRSARAAAKPVTAASLFDDSKPETKIWLAIRDRVDEKLPGRFDFNIVRNAALGGEKETAEGARLGSVDAGISTVSALSGWVPESQILDLPFLFRDADHVRRTVDGPLGRELAAQFAAQGFIVLGYLNYGARNLLAKQPVRTPKDVAGKSIRVLQSPLHTTLWRAYGAVPTQIPITETYNALKMGAVDMMDLTKSAYAGFKLYEVVPYLIETAHIWASGIVYVSKRFWDGLDANEKAVFAQAGAEGAALFNRLIVEDEILSMQQAKAAGGKVVQPERREDWVDGAEGVWQMMAPKLGGLDKIKAIAQS